MVEIGDMLVLGALFLLRLALPLIVTLVFGTLMNRLVDRWDAADRSAASRQLRSGD